MRPERLEIAIPAQPRYLAVVRSACDALLREAPEARLSERSRAEVLLVVQEACINAMRHGRDEGVADSVSVAFLVGEDRLTIEVRDRGRGFDPDAVPSPVPEHLQEGGYGVHIMKRSMDEFSVRRETGSFVVSLVKRYDLAEDTSPAVST